VERDAIFWQQPADYLTNQVLWKKSILAPGTPYFLLGESIGKVLIEVVLQLLSSFPKVGKEFFLN